MKHLMLNLLKQNKNRMIKHSKKIKKFLSQLAIVLVLSSMLISFSNSVSAAANGTPASTPIDDPNETTTTTTDGAATSDAQTTAAQTTAAPGEGKENLIFVPLDTAAYSDLPHLTQTTPTGMLNEFIGGLVRNGKWILGAFAVLYIMFAAVKLIILGSNEETVTKQKNALLFGIIGLVIIGFADELASVLSVACAPGEIECARGGFLKDPNNMIQQAALFNRTTRIFITFIKYSIGGIAVVMLVRNGIRLVALAGNEESVTVDKKNLVWISVGLVLIILASTLIDKVLYIVDPAKYSTLTGVEPAINPTRAATEIVGITNWVVLFTAPLGILILIAGALMYATAGGNEEQMNKAKRLILLAILGMVLIYGAFAVVSTIISGQFIP